MSLLPSLSLSLHWPPASASQKQLPGNLNTNTGPHVNFYTNIVSDRVGDKPQTLILPFTRSIPLWARVTIGESRFPLGKWN